MAIIATQDKTIVQATPYYKRMIRCPGHWLVSPKVDIYLREPVPLLKDCSDYGEYKGQRIKIKKMRIARDIFGNKKLDWKKLYELRRKGTGEVINPMVSAAWAIENVYDPKGMLCMACDKRCKEGQGIIKEFTIKRLCR